MGLSVANKHGVKAEVGVERRQYPNFGAQDMWGDLNIGLQVEFCLSLLNDQVSKVCYDTEHFRHADNSSLRIIGSLPVAYVLRRYIRKSYRDAKLAERECGDEDVGECTPWIDRQLRKHDHAFHLCS